MITREQSNFIKLAGIITMLIDHVGAYLFPLDILRIIGRLAFPLFAYQLGVGYRMTSNRANYLKRLTLFGVISQVPYFLLRGDLSLNILFSFVIGIILIQAVEEKRFLLFIPIVFFSFFIEYGIYGLSLILIFYFFYNKAHQFLLFLMVTLSYSLYYVSSIQIFSIFALPLIFKPFSKVSLPRNFFYIFYPVHLLLIYLAKVFISAI